MGSHRIERVNQLIHHEVASSLPKIMMGTEFNPAVVTVTHVLVTPDLRNARVFFSILGEPGEKRRQFGALLRKRVDIQKEMSRNVILKYTPRLHFEMDDSLKEGDRVLEILDRLDHEAPAEPPEPGQDHGPQT